MLNFNNFQPRMRSTMARSPQKVRKPGQIRMLGSAVRQEIVDCVQALGRATVAELAQTLGRPADGLYYHAKALVKAKLLLLERVRGTHGRMEAVFKPLYRGEAMRLQYDTEDRRNRDAVVATVTTMLRTTSRQFAAGFADGRAVTSGPLRNLWAARGLAWLTDEDLREVNRVLEELAGIISGSRKSKAARLHAITFALVPLPEKAARRENGKRRAHATR
jgi:hypothetical protein